MITVDVPGVAAVHMRGNRQEDRMKVRRLEVREHVDTRALYEEVFSEDSPSFVDYYYTEKTKDNVIYVVEEENRIQAMLHLNPYTVMVNGAEKAAHYIVAVATRKEYRKRGYMAALLKCALREMYEAGETFAFLMPAAEAIYLPYDFRTVYEQRQRAYKEEERSGACPAQRSDAAALADAAEKFLSENYQLYVKRDASYYERLMKECDSENGKLMVYRKDGKITDCRLFYKEDDKDVEEIPKIMVRIVDVRRMLMSVKLKTLMASCFTVTDPLIEENNRCVVITGTEYSGVMLMEGKPENSEGTISVAALASLLFGAKSVEELCAKDEVVLSRRLKGELKKMIPLSKIYLNETV